MVIYTILIVYWGPFCIIDIFDVFITYPDAITLVDFSPLTSKTNLYAFTWKEIQNIMKKVRLIESCFGND